MDLRVNAPLENNSALVTWGLPEDSEELYSSTVIYDDGVKITDNKIYYRKEG